MRWSGWDDSIRVRGCSTHAICLPAPRHMYLTAAGSTGVWWCRKYAAVESKLLDTISELRARRQEAAAAGGASASPLESGLGKVKLNGELSVSLGKDKSTNDVFKDPAEGVPKTVVVRPHRLDIVTAGMSLS